MQIENLKGKRIILKKVSQNQNYTIKKQRKQLAEEFEKEKQINNARIIEMQNTTIEQEKDKPSFGTKQPIKYLILKLLQLLVL